MVIFFDWKLLIKVHLFQRVQQQKYYSMKTKGITFLLLIIVLSQAAYNTTLALRLAHYASIAYQTESSINSWNCARCSVYPLTEVKVFSNQVGGIQGFTGYYTDQDIIIVSFRGSVNIPNWIINLSFAQTIYPRCPGCRVHAGFYNGFNLVKQIFIAQVQTLRTAHPTAKIQITGHSLGGALATLAAPELKASFGSVDLLLTFGKPRVGNAIFAAYIATIASTFRVVHNKDSVPQLIIFLFNYAHEGTEIWYTLNMGSYTNCIGESPGCQRTVPFFMLNVPDHSMDIYITLKTA